MLTALLILYALGFGAMFVLSFMVAMMGTKSDSVIEVFVGAVASAVFWPLILLLCGCEWVRSWK